MAAGDFIPQFTFSDPNLEHQVVAMNQLQEQGRQADQARALAGLNAMRENQYRNQALQNQQLISLAQLGEQARARDLANQQVENEMNLRRDLAADQLRAAREMQERQLGFYEKNPYFGRDMGALGFGAAQANNAAMSEGASLTGQYQNLESLYNQKLKAIDDDWPGLVSVVGRTVLHPFFGVDTPGQVKQRAKEALNAEFQQELNKLIGSAKSTRFNPLTKTFEPLTINMGMGGGSPTAAAAVNQTPATTPTIVPQNQVTPAPQRSSASTLSTLGLAGLGDLLPSIGRGTISKLNPFNYSVPETTPAPAAPIRQSAIPQQYSNTEQIVADWKAGKITDAQASAAYNQLLGVGP